MVKDHTEEVPTEEILPELEEDKIAFERLDIIETINKAIKYNPKMFGLVQHDQYRVGFGHFDKK